MFVNNYSKNVEAESNTELDTYAWSAKDKPLQEGSKTAYKGSYLAYPYGLYGYNPYFEKCLEGSSVRYGVGFKNLSDDQKSVIGTDNNIYRADLIISTISVDDLFGQDEGSLRYVGRKFIPFVLPTKNVIPVIFYSCIILNKKSTRVLWNIKS